MQQILPLASLGQDNTVPAPSGDDKGSRSFGCAQDGKVAFRRQEDQNVLRRIMWKSHLIFTMALS